MMAKLRKKFLKPAEVMKKVGISKTTLWQWQKDGYLVPVKVGRLNRYKVTDVDRILHGEELLLPADIYDLFDICVTTLGNWKRKGILIPVKVGGRNRYRISDIEKLTGIIWENDNDGIDVPPQ